MPKSTIPIFFILMISLFSCQNTEKEPNTEELKVIAQDPLNPEMVFVEGGTYVMGGHVDSCDCYAFDSMPEPREVAVHDFYMSKYEVTLEMGSALDVFSLSNQKERENIPLEPLREEEKSQVAMRFSWEDMERYIDTLNEVTGKKYRLPTAAEWEYAARGGQKSKGYRYAGSNDLDDVMCHYFEGCQDKYLRIGQHRPNELGLYDMTGNISEWCSDSIYIDSEFTYKNKYLSKGGDLYNTNFELYMHCQEIKELPWIYLRDGDDRFFIYKTIHFKEAGIRLVLDEK